MTSRTMLALCLTICFGWSLRSSLLWAAPDASDSSPFYRNYRFLELSGQQTPVIGQILKDQKLGRLQQDDVHVQLILARLYVDLGLHLKAVEILDALSRQELPETLYNEVWFELGKSYFHSGHYRQAQAAFNSMHGPGNRPDMRAERLQLLGLIAMARDDYGEAVQLMQQNWQQSSDVWALYSRFNLAVAQIRGGKLEQGLHLLKQTSLIDVQPRNAETRALIDKINQAIGYLYLQQEQADLARGYLEQVRIKGPYSNMALLGAGWASTMLQQYKRALVPWLELRGRDIREVPVQESMLSVPYAFEQLGAFGQAAEYYQQAIDAYQQEQGLLAQSIQQIESDGMQNVLAQMDIRSEQNWLRNIRTLDDQSATRYIRQLMDDDLYFNMMNNYREARFIKLNAENRREQINRMTGEMLDKLKVKQADASGEAEEQVKFVSIMAAGLFKRADSLILNADREIDRQLEKMKRRALHLLQQRKERLDVYLVQARLALAQTYDRMENR